MAQKTGQEEAEFKSVPETLNLCVNNCGVTGNPSNNNMCQNCFTTTASSSSASAAILTSSSSSSSSALKFDKSLRSSIAPPRLETDLNFKAVVETKIVAPEVVVPVKRVVNRCSGCKRKVGLTGFRCRCGELFCSEHRYSDRHDCSYDYKATGRETIARENPVVRAAKIVKL